MASESNQPSDDKSSSASSSGTPKRLAFFDMDRTILSENSGKSWLKFRYKQGEIGKRYMLRAVYWQVLYRAALLDMESLAKKLVADIEGDKEAEMVVQCQIWMKAELESLISPKAVKQITVHKEAGVTPVMITGASQFAARPIAKLVGIDEVLCSELEVVDGVFTGKLATMCFGNHKVSMATKVAKAHGVKLQDCVFYTDSFNDMPLLREVGEGVVINADARLLREAKKRGWESLRWDK